MRSARCPACRAIRAAWAGVKGDPDVRVNRPSAIVDVEWIR
ncbi:MAG TPA: hypothetical protein VIE15_05860 [Acidimicrobiales bacterium]